MSSATEQTFKRVWMAKSFEELLRGNEDGGSLDAAYLSEQGAVLMQAAAQVNETISTPNVVQTLDLGIVVATVVEMGT